MAPSPTRQSISVACGPITQPAPTLVSPSRLTPGRDRGVGADRHSRLHPDRARVQDRHPTPGVLLEDPALGEVLGAHQVGAVVYAQRDRRVLGGVGRDALAARRAGPERRP